MKKDINFPQVEGVNIAITRSKNELENYEWQVFLINKNNFYLKDVVIRSKGYVSKDNEPEPQQTSILRHHFTLVNPESHALIELIDPSVFHLYNEYWVSYFVNNQIFDKKFIFVPESIVEDNLIYIPQLEMEGILHP